MNYIEQLKALDSAGASERLPGVDVADRVVHQIEIRERFRPEAAQRRIFAAMAVAAALAAVITLAFAWNALDLYRDPMSGLLATITGGLS